MAFFGLFLRFKEATATPLGLISGVKDLKLWYCCNELSSQLVGNSKKDFLFFCVSSPIINLGKDPCTWILFPHEDPGFP